MLRKKRKVILQIFFRKYRSNIEPVEETVEKREIDIMSRINFLIFLSVPVSSQSPYPTGDPGFEGHGLLLIEKFIVKL